MPGTSRWTSRQEWISRLAAAKSPRHFHLQRELHYRGWDATSRLTPKAVYSVVKEGMCRAEIDSRGAGPHDVRCTIGETNLAARSLPNPGRIAAPGFLPPFFVHHLL